MKRTSFVVALVCLVFLAWTMSCQSPSSTGDPSSNLDKNNQSNSTNNNDNSNSGNTAMGFLRLLIKDNPIEDAKNIFVTISDIRVHGTGDNGDNWISIVQDPAIEIDLLALRDTPLALAPASIPAGTYNQIRMTVVSGRIIFGPPGPPDVTDTESPLTVPSNEVKTNLHFELAGGMTIQVTLDFDAKNSIHVVQKGHQDSYILRPVVNAVEVTEVTGS